MYLQLQMDPSAWQMLTFALLLGILLVAMVVDMRDRRVPNAVVLVGLLTGVLLHAIGPQPFRNNDGLFSLLPGALGWLKAVLGVLVALALFLPFYVLRVLGAGDVKLMAAVGAFAGPATSVNLALFVLLAGGLLALGYMAVSRNAWPVLRNTLLALGQFLPGSAGTFDTRTQTAWRMPYAVAIALGVVAYGAWILSGRAPIFNF